MAHAQRADLVFQRNERAHLYRWGCQFSRLLAFLQCGSAENDCIIVSKYVDHSLKMSLQGRERTTGYPLHSPLSPSLLLPCVSVCHQIPFALYKHLEFVQPLGNIWWIWIFFTWIYENIFMFSVVTCRPNHLVQTPPSIQHPPSICP